MTDTKALRERVAASGLKYKYIAEKLGINAYTLQRKIENDNEFIASEIAMFSELLDLTIEETHSLFFVEG